MKAISTVIFDLDGTLIDSAPSILASFAAAFEALQLQPAQALTPAVIGPPLLQTLKILSGSDDAALLARLAEAFKAHYDTEGYRATRVYAGIEDLLAQLHGSGLALYIATNKRHVPTERILDLLGWRRHFQATASLDTPQPPLPNKGALIRHLLERHALPAEHVLYVGDRHEDGVAADQASTGFFHATWGYESGPAQALPALAGDIAALRAHLDSHAAHGRR